MYRAGVVLALAAIVSAPRTPPATWHHASAGVETMQLVVQPEGVPWRTRVIVARADPARTRFSVRVARRDDGRGAWSIDSAPSAALLAFNAGQFSTYSPWGWIVQQGHETQAPGSGSLAPALIVDAAGRAAIVAPDSIAAVRARGGVMEAVQSYPTLLEGDGVIPRALLTPELGVDLTHRDSRLAVGVDSAGRLIVALTRFDAVDGVPLGPTVPEMAVLMRDLGCRRAMLLDGGISSQLVLREGRALRRWPAFRRVPVALVVTPR